MTPQEKQIRKAEAALVHAEAVKMLVKNNTFKATVTIAGMEMSVVDNATLLPAVDDRIKEIKAFLKGEPSEYMKPYENPIPKFIGRMSKYIEKAAIENTIMPCPICGKEPHHEETGENYVITCMTCKGVEVFRGYDKSKTMLRWNEWVVDNKKQL